MLTPFGKELRKYRIDKDMSAEEMAQKLGISSCYLYTIETGTRRISDNFMKKIIEKLELTPEQKKMILMVAEKCKGYSSHCVRVDLTGYDLMKRQHIVTKIDSILAEAR